MWRSWSFSGLISASPDFCWFHHAALLREIRELGWGVGEVVGLCTLTGSRGRLMNLHVLVSLHHFRPSCAACVRTGPSVTGWSDPPWPWSVSSCSWRWTAGALCFSLFVSQRKAFRFAICLRLTLKWIYFWRKMRDKVCFPDACNW